MKQVGANRLGRGAGLLLLGLGLAASTVALADAGKPSDPSERPWPAASTRRSQTVGYAPDPPAMREANQWVLTFRYQNGAVALTNARHVRFQKPIATPRRVGRWAVELLSGPTVVERLRFDFPLLGADELAGRRRPYNDPPRFETKATIVHRVMVPDSTRVSRARLIDRATGKSTPLPWPPNVAAAKPDAGAPDARTDARHVDGSHDGSADSSARDAARPDAWRMPDGSAPPDAPPSVPPRPDGGKPDATPVKP